MPGVAYRTIERIKDEINKETSYLNLYKRQLEIIQEQNSRIKEEKIDYVTIYIEYHENKIKILTKELEEYYFKNPIKDAYFKQ